MIRKVIFWLHLAAGVMAGVVIGIMSLTGVALAFEKEIIAWSERDARKVAAPSPGAERLRVDDLLARLRKKEEGRPTGLTVYADPNLAVLASYGRTNAYYLNPYTGEIRQPASDTTRKFMQSMIEWHRYVAASGEHRNTGKAVTGACNAAFLVLAITGLYLWWPRQWSAKALKAIGVMSFKLRGKARDWNWHNAIGLWSAPILIVLTATAMPISYRWASDLIYKITGTQAPAAGGPGAAAAAAVQIPTPAEGAQRLTMDALIASAQKAAPAWQQITLRPGGGGGGRAGGPAGRSGARGTGETNRLAEAGASREQRGSERREGRGGEARPEAQAVTLTIKANDGSPRFASTQLTLDPYTGNVLKREGYADYNAGRKVRSWTRFLHTGEALGPGGQAVAGAASLGGVVLVWTGFALAIRRFLAWRRRIFSKASVVAESSAAPAAEVK